MPSEKKPMIINSRKFDRKISRSWKAELIEETDEFYVFFGLFEEEVKHSKLGVIRRNTASYEFYWKNKWFNIFRFHEPEGNLRNFYCNVNQPPILKDGVLDYVDLDIDVLVWENFEYEILDLDEFNENIQKFNYSDELQKQVQSSLDEILNLVKNKDFPFDYKSST